VLDELVDAAGVEPAPVQTVQEQVALEHQRLARHVALGRVLVRKELGPLHALLQRLGVRLGCVCPSARKVVGELRVPLLFL